MVGRRFNVGSMGVGSVVVLPILLGGALFAAAGCAAKATRQEFVGSVPDWRTLVTAQPTSTESAEPPPAVQDTEGGGEIEQEAPDTTGGTPPPAEPQEDPATYSGYVDQIKSVMPGSTSGIASAIRIENQTTGHRSSYIFKTSSNFDTFADGAFYIAVLSRNNEDLYIRIPKLRPGHYECPDFDLLLGDSDKSLSDPEAAQAANTGGHCEVDIYPGDNPKDIQGKFTGKLMFNNGEFSYTIESGYFYARDALSNEYVAPKPTYPKPPVGPTGPGPSNPNNQQHNYHR